VFVFNRPDVRGFLTILISLTDACLTLRCFLRCCCGQAVEKSLLAALLQKVQTLTYD